MSAATESQVKALMDVGLVRRLARACVGAGVATVEFMRSLTGEELATAAGGYLQSRGKPPLTALEKKALASVLMEPAEHRRGVAAADRQVVDPARRELLDSLAKLREVVADETAPMEVLRAQLRDATAPDLAPAVVEGGVWTSAADVGGRSSGGQVGGPNGPAREPSDGEIYIS